MTEDEIIEYVGALPGVDVLTASELNGSPETAWGDSFFSYDPAGDLPPNQRMPFATLVIQDYAGFDTASDLNRDSVFRLNIAVGKASYEELLGHPAATHPQHNDDYDYTATDVLLPHPVYATQGWVCVLNPAEHTSEQVRTLLQGARDLAQQRHDRRAGEPEQSQAE